ncbi:MAG TPA: leucyl aminopeptidase [Pyrinomonadaceae bacterium]|nr:leucyl aminopeptidase [Pyrinomonadaceae bacterium]
MTNPNRLRVGVAAEPAPGGVRELLARCVFKGAGVSACGAGGAAQDFARRLVAECDFKGDEGDTFLVHAAAACFASDPAAAREGKDGTANAPSDLTAGNAGRLLLVGAGEREEDGDLFRASLRRAAATAVRRARETKAARVAFILPDCDDRAGAARAAAEGACLGSYENDFYQKREDDDQSPLEEFVVVADGADEEMRAAVERGRVVAESANWARSLADEPGGSLPPLELARRAAEMAGEFNLKIETLDAAEIQARGMGGLWGVGKGSDEPPALIAVSYEPEGAADGDELWAFVGKGITFDTGGISIKPAEGMEEMKSDMAGGAAALGALRALAQLRPRRRVVAVVPAAENMPSGRSIKPGDVIRTHAGHTIEVVDTDAEGRLVLVDGISYAKQLGATRIVDLATLTGSIIVALGDHRAGLFSNDDEWARQVEHAARRAGEPVWRMPVSDDYKKKIESDIADFKNYGGRPDATGAALLLSKFAADTPWAHLDIAATAWLEDEQPHAPAGATGAGVRTLVELACGQTTLTDGD